MSYNHEYGHSSHSQGDLLDLPQEPSIVGSYGGALLWHAAMNWIRVISPRTSDEEKGSSVHQQILLLLGTHLCAGRSYYSEVLVRLPTEPGSPTANGLTDNLQSCWSYSPCRCLTARPICLGGSAL